MVAQNGVTDSVEEAPIPCSVHDIVEVPSKTEEGYTYLLRVPKLRERMQLEARLGSVSARLNQSRLIIRIMREHESELHRICGKPVLFEQFTALAERGEVTPEGPVREANIEYTTVARRLDPRVSEILIDQALAWGEYQVAMVEALVCGAIVKGKRYEDMSAAWCANAVQNISDADLEAVFEKASDLWNLRGEVKKSLESR